MSLILDARQRAMLAEMGVAVWQPKGGAVPDVPATPAGPAAQAAPSATRSAAPAQAPAGPVHADLATNPLTPLGALTAAVQAEQGAASSATELPGQHPAQADSVTAAAAAVAEQAAAPAPTRAPAVTPPLPAAQATPSGVPANPANAGPVFGAATQDDGGRPPIPQPAMPAANQAVHPASPVSPAPAAPATQATVAPVMRAASGPVASMDWATLRETVRSCEACGLCHGRTQTVFGVGAERADWLVVGEAPGEQEDLRGEPFVGPAGQLLDAMLRAVGKDRQAPAGEQAVFIANVLKCRPPGNRNPAPDEVAQCEPNLRRQVELVQPKLILALGRFAVQALLNTTEPIGRLRRQVHRYQGVPVVVSYHPAYLLRNLPDKAKAWADLVLAMRVARGGQ